MHDVIAKSRTSRDVKIRLGLKYLTFLSQNLTSIGYLWPQIQIIRPWSDQSDHIYTTNVKSIYRRLFSLNNLGEVEDAWNLVK